MKTILEILRWLISKAGWLLLLISPILAFLKVIEEKFGIFTNAISDLSIKLSSARAQVVPDWGSVSPYLTYANSLFPLNETFILIGVWVGLKIVAVVIRWIKAIIPGLG